MEDMRNMRTYIECTPSTAMLPCTVSLRSCTRVWCGCGDFWGPEISQADFRHLYWAPFQKQLHPLETSHLDK